MTGKKPLAAEQRLNALEKELRIAREQLLATTEQLATSQEMLRRANQQMLAVGCRFDPDDQEQQALNDLTEQKRAEESLVKSRQQSELHLAQLQAILDSLNDGVVIADLQGTLFHWNPAALAMHGFASMDECRCTTPEFAEIYDLASESRGVLPVAERPLSRILAGETLRDWKLQVSRRGADWKRVFSYSGTLARDKAGEPLLAVISITDITEHKRMEADLRRAQYQLEQRVLKRTEELAQTVETLQGEICERHSAEASLRRLNSLYAALSAIDLAIVRAVDRDSIFRDFCRIAVQHGGFLLAWVGLVDDAGGPVEVAAASGATAYLQEIRVSADEVAEGEGPTGISIRKGTHCICNDFQNDPRTLPWHEKGKLHGIRASASIAIKEEGVVIGALTLYAAEKNFFDRQHMALLLQMGADISFALDNLLREARRREAEQALQKEILERLRAVEELREKERLLIQQSRQAALGEMIGNIAHQWRQPLNTLGLLIQELAMEYETGEMDRPSLEITVDNAMQIIQHMSQTIDDFRNFFRPDKGKVSFGVRQVVDKVVSIIGASLKEHRIELEVSTNCDPQVEGYPNEYSQVLLNILLNARDALSERRIDKPRIQVALSEEMGKTVVTIEDNAGGIPDAIMDKIFDPYFTTKGPDKGSGIGLHMSKAIIEQNMNGSLTAGNQAAGARFRIEV
jgi:PAS domain S-box-containing protein